MKLRSSLKALLVLLSSIVVLLPASVEADSITGPIHTDDNMPLSRPSLSRPNRPDSTSAQAQRLNRQRRLRPDNIHHHPSANAAKPIDSSEKN